MRMSFWSGALSLCVALWFAMPSGAAAAGAGNGMAAFADEAELNAYLRRVREDHLRLNREEQERARAAQERARAEQERLRRQQQRSRRNRGDGSAIPPPPPLMATAAPVAAEAAAPGITNNQTANVDEGGIVKTYGTYLVVLRRGRLFTVDTAGNSLRAVDQINAFPPADRGGAGAWYDEMLVSNDMVIVIGFNYARQGTEINRFRISREGRLTYVDTHHLRSNDYFSSRNYASRLIGTRLIVYAPLYFNLHGQGGQGMDQNSLPALRRWSRGGPRAGFESLVTPRRVFVADLLRTSANVLLTTTHSVVSCDLAAAELSCSATVILGNASRNFYVGSDAVYVWTSGLFRPVYPTYRHENRSMLYRIPLDGGTPQAIGVWGAPTDQFSFLADGDDLNVLVRSDGAGDGMWGPEQQPGDLALLRLPLGRFGNGSRMAPPRLYQPLPGRGQIGGLQNRFVGRHLLYSGERMWQWNQQTRQSERGAAPPVYVVGLDTEQITPLASTLSVSRIDQMGQDAMVIGTNDANALVFQSVTLGRTPAAADSYALPGAREGENRSHAYFFRQDNADGTDGLLGLPVATALTNPNARFLGSGSGIFFLRRAARQLSPAGQLDADTQRVVQDNCLASCVDWYGNARPIFYGQRIFALMGYELVEGRMQGGQMGEVRRVNFAPHPDQQRQN
jgi:hypothetical protein